MARSLPKKFLDESIVCGDGERCRGSAAAASDCPRASAEVTLPQADGYRPPLGSNRSGAPAPLAPSGPARHERASSRETGSPLPPSCSPRGPGVCAPRRSYSEREFLDSSGLGSTGDQEWLPLQ
ncbi:large ribosomal subunit protein mL63 isoform X1 [Lathamus discolor]|uniref:large ribosomal subunit protein mL63 isoform X1 n=1 Tax=Lathamus discolor TaxID=678569 RepID=UPI0032B7EF30